MTDAKEGQIAKDLVSGSTTASTGMPKSGATSDQTPNIIKRKKAAASRIKAQRVK